MCAEKIAFERRVFEIECWAREVMDHEAALRCFAAYMAAAEELHEMLKVSVAENIEAARLLTEQINATKELADIVQSLGKDVPEWLKKAVQSGALAAQKHNKIRASKQAKQAAEARHSRPGSSRSNREAIKAAWAGGKYSSRDRCAEEECRALNMSLATARKALRKTPEPPARCSA